MRALFAPARTAIRSTRAPARPYSANSSMAAARMRSGVAAATAPASDPSASGVAGSKLSAPDPSASDRSTTAKC